MASLAFVKQMADAQLKAIGNVTSDMTVDFTDEEENILKECSKQVTLFDFGGPLSFGAAADVGHQVRERAKNRAALILDFHRVPFIDVSSARAVETIASDAKIANKQVFVSGMSEEIRNMLIGLHAEIDLSEEAFFDNRVDAVKAARDYILDNHSEDGVVTEGATPIPQSGIDIGFKQPS